MLFICLPVGSVVGARYKFIAQLKQPFKRSLKHSKPISESRRHSLHGSQVTSPLYIDGGRPKSHVKRLSLTNADFSANRHDGVTSNVTANNNADVRNNKVGEQKLERVAGLKREETVQVSKKLNDLLKRPHLPRLKKDNMDLADRTSASVQTRELYTRLPGKNDVTSLKSCMSKTTKLRRNRFSDDKGSPTNCSCGADTGGNIQNGHSLSCTLANLSLASSGADFVDSDGEEEYPHCLGDASDDGEFVYIPGTWCNFSKHVILYVFSAFYW